MSATTLLARDLPLWADACPFLDVRSNDVHTLISYGLARGLLGEKPQVDAAVVLPAILLHDVGWKRIDPALLIYAVGPNPTRRDLIRDHERHGVEIAGEILRRHRPAGVDIDAVLAIIDRHDTEKAAHSPEDALVKDADKLWRFSPHGVQTIGGWFDSSARDTILMLEDFVLPQMLTASGRAAARGFIAAARAALEAPAYLEDKTDD